MTPDEKRRAFGQAVMAARSKRLWSLKELAFQALGSGNRKSYVSAVERGKQPMTAVTVQKFAKALALPDAVVRPMLGLPLAVDDAPTPTETRADALAAATESEAKRLKIGETMVLALAYEYAGDRATDLETAVKELRRALEVAAEERARLPSNLGEAVDAVVARVRALNDQGRMEEGMTALKAALAAQRDREAEAAAATETLLDRALAQAVLTRSVEDAAFFAVERVDRMGGGHEERFRRLRIEQDKWYVRGRDRGLAFDLEVSIALARASVERAQGADLRGAALNDLAIALNVFGQREPDTALLEEAVKASRTALEGWRRERTPLNWGIGQLTLGTSLGILGERETGTARLEEAVLAYLLALEEQTRERVPLQWAMTQMNLGNALAILGQREADTARLEKAVEAYRAALKVWTRERKPLDWALTHMNLGNALRALGERESSTARLEEALGAHRLALEERTRERVPFQWAQIQENLALAELTLADNAKGATRLTHLRTALDHVDAALEVYSFDNTPYDHSTATALRDHLIATLSC